MQKTCFFLLLLCLTLKNVFSLVCYKSNVTESVNEHSQLYGVVMKVEVPTTHRPEDCSEIEVEGPKPEYSCYKVLFIDRTSDKVGQIKGCFPNKGCEWMVDYVKERIDLPENDVQCYKCDKDRCNGGPTIRSKLFQFIAILGLIYGAV